MSTLTGESVSSGLSLEGTGNIRFTLDEEDIKNFRKLKLYLIENFMEPLIYKELEKVNRALKCDLNDLKQNLQSSSKEISILEDKRQQLSQQIEDFNETLKHAENELDLKTEKNSRLEIGTKRFEKENATLISEVGELKSDLKVLDMLKAFRTKMGMFIFYPLTPSMA